MTTAHISLTTVIVVQSKLTWWSSVKRAALDVKVSCQCNLNILINFFASTTREYPASNRLLFHRSNLVPRVLSLLSRSRERTLGTRLPSIMGDFVTPHVMHLMSISFVNFKIFHWKCFGTKEKQISCQKRWQKNEPNDPRSIVCF